MVQGVTSFMAFAMTCPSADTDHHLTVPLRLNSPHEDSANNRLLALRCNMWNVAISTLFYRSKLASLVFHAATRHIGSCSRAMLSGTDGPDADEMCCRGTTGHTGGLHSTTQPPLKARRSRNGMANGDAACLSTSYSNRHRTVPLLELWLRLPRDKWAPVTILGQKIAMSRMLDGLAGELAVTGYDVRRFFHPGRTFEEQHIPKTTALSPVRPGVRVRRNGGESAPLRQTQGTGNNYNRTALDEVGKPDLQGSDVVCKCQQFSFNPRVGKNPPLGTEQTVNGFSKMMRSKEQVAEKLFEIDAECAVIASPHAHYRYSENSNISTVVHRLFLITILWRGGVSYRDEREIDVDTKSFHQPQPKGNFAVDLIGTCLKNYHEYYRSHYYTHYPPGRGFWVDVDSERNGHTIANGLPGRNMNTKNVRLSFDFPFYGSPIRNITIAVKGFMSIGSALSHSLASTQYIAPLMANFDPGLDPMSVVRYRDNGQTFTFQVTLSRDGRIIFVYKKIPKPVTSIDDSSHPVRVGISDAYTVEALLVPFSDINRKTSTIYEYHTIELEKGRVATGSAIVLSPLPTCGQFRDCNSCLRSKTGFNCRWCPSLNRCSDGYDRSRQQWVDAGCDKQAGYVRCRTGNVPLLEVPSTSVTTRAKPTRPSLVFRRFPTTAESRLTNVRDDKSINFPETTSNSRQRINVWQVTNDDPGVGTDHRVTDTLDNRDQERTSYGIPQTLEIEVVICILVAVVIVVVAIAWIIHSYSRRPGLELFVVEEVPTLLPSIPEPLISSDWDISSSPPRLGQEPCPSCG
ncbi:Plexin domain-containing protein 2 [Branchiostoma belcheri]|nr:Plexin domain-containing protein 2 [Branchiostoma belcheri]